MALEHTIYTDSFMSDVLKEFFNRFKENNSYKYVEMIDSRVILSQIIEIDYNEFSDKVKQMLEEQTEERIHKSIYRAIGEIFQIRYGSAELENVKQEDVLKFRVLNYELLHDKTFSNPGLVDYKSEDDKNKEIDVYEIADQLMKEYYFKTLEKTKEILFYAHGIYREGGEEIISKRSRKLMNNIKLNHIREILGIIRDETGYVSHDEFDKESFMVNMTNYVYNLKTGEKTEHSPKYLSRDQIPIYYDPDAACPRFDKFLSTSLENNEQKIRTVLEMIALCLIKNNSLLSKAFMNTGRGSNGKSILFGIILEMIGKENISAKTIHDFEKNHFATSALEGKLANICADVGHKGIIETENLKKIISGDPVDCERKFMDGYTFMPYATLIFSANDIPEISDESDGFARRFELIEWRKSFYGKDRDNSVKTIRKDPNELSGIFNKVSKIAKELLQTHSLKFESTVEDVKIQWLNKSDSTKRFVDESLSKISGSYCPVAIVFSRYNKFCKDNGMTPLSDRGFNAKMTALGFSRGQKKVDGANMKVWIDVDFTSNLSMVNQKIIQN